MEFDIEKELEELEELLKGNNFKSKVYLSFDCLDKFFKSQDFIEIVASANFNHNSFSETRNFISNILYIATSYVETFGTIATASYDEMKKLIKNIVLHANENSNKLANLDIESVITGMIENKLFKDLNISKKNATKEQIEMVKCQAVDLVNYSANKYHAFNSKDLDSILANGIDPNSKDKQVEKDKREILEAINGILYQGKIQFSEVEDKTEEELEEYLHGLLVREYEEKIREIPEEVTSEFEKAITLRVIDTYWMEHINTMSHLREGIHLRGYAQENPLRAYKSEGYELFDNLLAKIDQQTTVYLMKAEIRQNTERKEVVKKVITNDGKDTVKTSKKSTKIGRNDPCPCGSGKKYKQCCGK